jgi:hypothetical protein
LHSRNKEIGNICWDGLFLHEQDSDPRLAKHQKNRQHFQQDIGIAKIRHEQPNWEVLGVGDRRQLELAFLPGNEGRANKDGRVRK